MLAKTSGPRTSKTHDAVGAPMTPGTLPQLDIHVKQAGRSRAAAEYSNDMSTHSDSVELQLARAFFVAVRWCMVFVLSAMTGVGLALAPSSGLLTLPFAFLSAG